jgi:hypothetical protein
MSTHQLFIHGHDRKVRQWTQRDGVAYVNGKRAFGHSGCTGLKVRTHVDALCSHCASGGRYSGFYTARAELFGRFESALGRPLFWFRQVTWCPVCNPER